MELSQSQSLRDRDCSDAHLESFPVHALLHVHGHCRSALVKHSDLGLVVKEAAHSLHRKKTNQRKLVVPLSGAGLWFWLLRMQRTRRCCSPNERVSSHTRTESQPPSRSTRNAMPTRSSKLRRHTQKSGKGGNPLTSACTHDKQRATKNNHLSICASCSALRSACRIRFGYVTWSAREPLQEYTRCGTKKSCSRGQKTLPAVSSSASANSDRDSVIRTAQRT
jgi:hypothetical protein